jgi:hypothetical protein
MNKNPIRADLRRRLPMPSRPAHAVARAVGKSSLRSGAISVAAIADGVLPAALPADALDDRIAIVGTAGSGKTHPHRRPARRSGKER